MGISIVFVTHRLGSTLYIDVVQLRSIAKLSASKIGVTSTVKAPFKNQMSMPTHNPNAQQ